MKKIGILLMAALMTGTLVTGCASNSDKKETTVAETTAKEKKETKETKKKETEKEKETKETKEKETKETKEKETKKKETEKTTEAETSAKETKESETGKGKKSDISKLSDDIYSFQLQVDGEVYQFPMTYADFADYGWKYNGDDSQSLDSNYVAKVQVFQKGDLQCYAEVCNFDNSARPFKDCYITGIQIDKDQIKKTESEVIAPKGIQVGVSSKDDIIAAYGEATNDVTTSNGNSGSLTYSMDYGKEVKFYFFEDFDHINYVSVSNEEKPADFVEGGVSSESPEIVGKYQAPEAVSDNFGDYTVEFGGDLYQMPVLVSAMVENGWTIDESDSDATVNGRDSGWVSLMKDNQKMRAITTNYSPDATVITNCFITNLKASDLQVKTTMTISKNITMGMSEDDLKAALEGVECETSDSSSFNYYEIKPGSKASENYTITVNKEKAVVSGIEVNYGPSYSEYTNR